MAIDKARRVAEARDLAVDWRVGDVTDPEVLGDDSFDLIVVAYLHLPAPELAALRTVSTDVGDRTAIDSLVLARRA